MEGDQAFLIRPEQRRDALAIRTVHRRAFGQPQEAQLVDALRRDGAAFVSLVAEAEGEVVGHILFSPVMIEGGGRGGEVVTLAPMSVMPERQRQGMGSALVREGLAACRHAGATAVIVLGHPEYYPRFGFVPADTFGIRSEYPASPEAYFALELTAGALDARKGLVRYHPAFADV